MSISDMKRTMPIWMNTSIAVFKDTEASQVGPLRQSRVRVQVPLYLSLLVCFVFLFGGSNTGDLQLSQCGASW